MLEKKEEIVLAFLASWCQTMSGFCFCYSFLRSADETTDKGGENTAGHGCSSTTFISSARRLPQTAGSRIREGNQTERARGQRRKTSECDHSRCSSRKQITKFFACFPSCSQTSWATTLYSSSSSQIRLLQSLRPRCPSALSSSSPTAII